MADETIQIDNLTRRPPFKRQLRALFLKNFALQLKYKKTNALLLILPAIASLIVAGFTGLAVLSTDYDCCPDYVTNAGNIRDWIWAYYVNSTNYDDIGNLTTQGYHNGFIHQQQLSNGDYFPPEYEYVPFFVEAPSSNWIDDTTWDALETWGDYVQNYETPPFSDTQNVATAAVEFQKLNPSSLEIEYVIQTDTTDYVTYYFDYDRYSGLEARYIFTYYMHSSLIQSYINTTMNETVELDYVFVSFASYVENGVTAIMLVMYILPLMFTMLLPFIAYMMVSERSTRFLEMMKIMGLKMKAYWIINLSYYGTVVFISLMFMYLISVSIYGSGNWAVETSPVVIILLCVLWAFSGTSFAMLWSQFFAKPMPAACTVIFVVHFSFAGFLGIALMFDTLLSAFGLIAGNLFITDATDMKAYDSVDNIPWWCVIFPVHTFVYGFFLMSRFLYNTEPQHMSLAHWSTAFTTQMRYVYIAMIVQIVVALFLTKYVLTNSKLTLSYFHHVLPSQYGYIRPWNYLFKSTKKMSHFNTVIDSNIDVEETEGADCKNERRRATNLRRPLPVRLVFLKKEYEHKYKQDDDDNVFKVALASFCLTIDNGECVGLLGPNGAGKSTVMNILTGLIPPTSGFAVIHGHNIITDMEQIHQLVGFCPQFDVLWEELTIEEHLLFYIRLKGAVPKALEQQELKNMLGQLKFSDAKKSVPVSQVSGGERRRVSIGIAFLGNPKLILLDEPTTGLDMSSRYQIWDLINERKVGRSILLTTHNMQEADVLCSRIGIISRGKLLCIDQPPRLKARFGKGFKLSVIPTRGTEGIERYLMNKHPSMQIEPANGRSLQFLIPSTLHEERKESDEEVEVNLSDVLTDVIKLKKEMKIEEWKLNQCSIEEVFLNLIHEEEILE